LSSAALSLGEQEDTKTRHHRTVRLLAPVREDLADWRQQAPKTALVFPAQHGGPWSLPA
jgi:hypothetical protein